MRIGLSTTSAMIAARTFRTAATMKPACQLPVQVVSQHDTVTRPAYTAVTNTPRPSAMPSNPPASPAPTFGDSVAKMLIPAFADELKFQSGGATRIVTMSLKARAAITLAGHQGDAVTWFDGYTGNWLTSSAYPQAPFVAAFVTAHPVASDSGKPWSLLLPDSAYRYDKTARGAGVTRWN